MKVAVDLRDRVAIATMSGEIDLTDGMHFTDELLGKMPDAANALVIDLTDLTYIDSAGVRSLFEIGSSLRMRDQSFAVAVPEDSLLRSVLKITNIESIASICPTLEDAISLLAVDA